MRKIRITFYNGHSEEIEYKEFSNSATDWDIDDYCYDILENCYNDNYYYFWEEFE